MRENLALDTRPKATLIAYTPDPELVVASAGRQCRSFESALKIREEMTLDKAREFIRKLIKMGHTSVLEHASFTFQVENISRVCSHQLVRHRIASYSQQSLRHIRAEKLSFIIPNSLSLEQKKEFLDIVSRILSFYSRLVENGVPVEDARYILPMGVTTKIVVTMNARELLESFFRLRLCLKAQWEIRELARQMLEQVRRVAPAIFERAGPTCVLWGYCHENDRKCPMHPGYPSL